MQNGTIRSGCQQKVWDYVSGHARRAVKRLLEAFMEHRRDIFCGCAHHARSPFREAYRNGYYERSLDTLWGTIKLRVPRVRSRQESFDPLVLDRYKRRQEQLNEAVLRWVAGGMSAREVSRSLKDVFGTAVSPGTISNIVAELDSEIQAFHRRPLDVGYRWVYLDAKHCWVSYRRKRPGRGKKKAAALLLAWGVGHDGTEELIDFRVADSESRACWQEFLTDLEGRGLRRRDRWGRKLQMIVTDGDMGLLEALHVVYPRVPKQRCVFHKVRSIADHLEERSHREAILSEAAGIYEGVSHRREALERLGEWQEDWGEIEPKAVRRFAYEFEDTLTYLNAAPEWRVRLKTTNPIERFIRELNKKIEKVGIFPSARSLERTAYLMWQKLQQQGYGRTGRRSPPNAFTHES